MIAGASFAIALRELAAWQLTADELAVAIDRVRDDFRRIIAASVLEWRQRAHTRRIELDLPAPRSRAEAAGDSAFREILEELLPSVQWELCDG